METSMFIAITRFSLFLPNSSAWIVSSQAYDRDKIEEYRSKLFNEHRLDFRIKFLSKITLPILREASKDYNFVHIIEYSDSLPKKYLEELKKLEENYSFVKLSEYNLKGESLRTVHEIAIDFFKLSSVTDKDHMIGQFVLDDDDCISLDYFRRSSKYLNKHFHGHNLSFGLGVAGIFNKDFNLTNTIEMYYPKVNIGLLRIGAYRHQSKKIVFGSLGSHMKADKYSPTIIDSRKISFFWSKHLTQDSAERDFHNDDLEKLNKINPISKDAIAESFGKNFIRDINDI